MTDKSTPIRYVDRRAAQSLAPFTAGERERLHTVNQRIAARPGLVEVLDYLFDETQALIPCDRISFAFVEEDGLRVTSHFTRASYEPVLLTTGYSENLRGSSLQRVLETGMPRIIDDLKRYSQAHPQSRSTRLLLREGVRSSLTCPLQVEDRVVGFMFRSSRRPATYDRRHAELQLAIVERLSEAVEKAWRIEQLEQANHAYFELLGFVSHELQNPLASLVTDARLLADGYLGDLAPDQKAKAEHITEKGVYLIDLIREYLDLAKMEGGTLRLHARSDVSFADEVVTPVIDLFHNQLDAARMRLKADDVPPDLPPVEGDPALLRIALANLLSNAVRYGRPGGLVRIAARRQLDAYSVSVWNEGPGFSADQRDKLFRKFSRLKTPELADRRGTGLGLYNTWRIVHLHNGTVAAGSEAGSWAEFSFIIPQPLGAPPTAGGDS